MSGQGGGGSGKSSPAAPVPAAGADRAGDATPTGQPEADPSAPPEGFVSQLAVPGSHSGRRPQNEPGEDGARPPRPIAEEEEAQRGNEPTSAGLAQGQLPTVHAPPEPEPRATLAGSPQMSGRGTHGSGLGVAQGHKSQSTAAGQAHAQAQADASVGLGDAKQTQAGPRGPGVYVSLDVSDSSSPDRRASQGAEGSAYGASAQALAQSALQVVRHIEMDAAVAGESVAELLGQLSAFLRDAAANTAAHVEVERDAAGLLQAAALDAAARGNKMVNSYLRLHEELRDLPHLCLLVKTLRQRVDLFDAQLRHFLPR